MSNRNASDVRQAWPGGTAGELWPALPLDEWEDTYHTLHMWTQIVGKVRMGPGYA